MQTPLAAATSGEPIDGVSDTLGVVRYQASRVLPAVPQGALGALAWTAVLVAPAVAGVLAARRFTSGQALPPAAGPASGFSARLRKAFALYGAGTEGAAESEARIRQGVAAGLVAGLMAVAVVQVHLPAGFFWTSGGYEYPLLWGIVALSFAIRGGGRYSVDHYIGKEF